MNTRSVCSPALLDPSSLGVPGGRPQCQRRARQTSSRHSVSRRFTIALLAGLSLGIPAKPQKLVTPEQTSAANRLFDSRATQNTLPCRFRTWQPHLDFNFRFVTGFDITARFGEFAIGEGLLAILKVTPEGSSPVLLAETFEIPQVPRTMAGQPLMSMELTMGGGFAMGEGQYAVELLLLDKRERSFYKQWTLKTGKYSDRSVPPTLQPLKVAPLAADNWAGKLDPKGIRLTVLLDATATNAYEARLWNHTLLVQLLDSLLKQVPCQSVNIVAFNLDQQVEIFRQENFDAAGAAELANALEGHQTATISLHALEPGRWLDFLLRITREQNSTDTPSDAVVFIGTNTHFSQKPPKDFADSQPPVGPHFFYFEFYGFRTPFPDTLDYVTRTLHGTVFRINSPMEFGKAVQKMRTQLSTSLGGTGTR